MKKNSKNSKKNESDLERLVHVIDALQKKRITLDKALEFIRDVTYARRVLLVLLSPVDGDLYIEAAAGLSPEQKQQGHYVMGEGVVGRVIQSGEPIFIEDAAHNPLFLNRTHAFDCIDNISFLCVPIKLNDNVIGAIGIDRPSVEIKSSEHEERLLSVLVTSFTPYIKQYQKIVPEQEENLKQAIRLPSYFKAERRELIGNSPNIELIYERIKQVAPTPTTVMLRGESGTGKELVAHSIHQSSSRCSEKFISLNCAALPESLVESELFGHERGAFTGANQNRIGRFEMAHKGTFFLDEVGELSLTTQAKLLRVLQEKSFERLGSTVTQTVDVRIIAATNRNLEQMVEEGSFRKDLYYRLNVFSLFLPPLRERKRDVLLLADYFLETFAQAHGKLKPKLSLTVTEMLERYSWPGNIRELENIIERCMILIGDGKYVLPQHLPLELHSSSCPQTLTQTPITATNKGSLPERLEELERIAINEALSQSKGHMGQAAKNLGITERVLGQRMTKYSLHYKDFR